MKILTLMKTCIIVILIISVIFNIGCSAREDNDSLKCLDECESKGMDYYGKETTNSELMKCICHKFVERTERIDYGDDDYDD